MPFIDRDELRLAFDDAGEGRPIVLCHSYLCSREMWAHAAGALARSYRVLNLDLRGHGDSGPADEPFGPHDLVDDVVTVLDRLGIDSAVWCGLSIGGMTAMRAALTAPDRVAALVVAGSSAAAEPLGKRLKYRLLATAARLFGLRRMIPTVLPIMFGRTSRRRRPELVAEWAARMASMHMPSLLNFLDMLLRRDAILDRLPQVAAPTLVLVGAEDRAQPPRRSRQIARAIPDAELVVIPQAGHLSALEQPEAVTGELRAFLGRLETASASLADQRT